jgi:hypothetical protein
MKFWGLERRRCWFLLFCSGFGRGGEAVVEKVTEGFELLRKNGFLWMDFKKQRNIGVIWRDQVVTESKKGWNLTKIVKGKKEGRGGEGAFLGFFERGVKIRGKGNSKVLRKTILKVF